MARVMVFLAGAAMAIVNPEMLVIYVSFSIS